MDSLEKAKALAERAETIGHPDTAHLKARIATAHALIALVERLDKLTITNKDFTGKDVSHLRVEPHTTGFEF